MSLARNERRMGVSASHCCRAPGTTMPLRRSARWVRSIVANGLHPQQSSGPGRPKNLRALSIPDLAGLIDRLGEDSTWSEIRQAGTCHRALGHLWDELAAIV